MFYVMKHFDELVVAYTKVLKGVYFLRMSVVDRSSNEILQKSISAFQYGIKLNVFMHHNFIEVHCI